MPLFRIVLVYGSNATPISKVNRLLSSGLGSFDQPFPRVRKDVESLRICSRSCEKNGNVPRDVFHSNNMEFTLGGPENQDDPKVLSYFFVHVLGRACSFHRVEVT